MPEMYSKISIVDSPLGRKNVDSSGSAISGVRMDPSMPYSQIPELLQKYINDGDNSSWANITNKIDYIYYNLDYALVQSEIKSGKNILRWSNLSLLAYVWANKSRFCKLQ